MRIPVTLLLWVLQAIMALPASCDDLTLFFISAPKPIEWTSPDRVFVSTFNNFLTVEKEKVRQEGSHSRNVLASHAISHVDVRVRCAGELDHWSGMTSQNPYAGLDTLLGNGGLEILMIAEKGRLYSEDEIKESYPSLNSDGRLSFFQVQVSSQTCQRLLQYEREYREKGYDKVYGGLQHRPRFGEGAGCSAYAASFLEVAGLMTPAIKSEWSRTIHIPKDLIGSFWHPARLGFYDYVILGETATWAQPEEPQLSLEFWDPQLMHNWVQKTWYERPTDALYSYLQDGNALGLGVDRRDVETPSEPLWKQP